VSDMKDFRRIATRCDKLARNYASAVARCPRTKSEQKEDKSFNHYWLRYRPALDTLSAERRIGNFDCA
jgi:predicted amidophosphoribosyltransferase